MGMFDAYIEQRDDWNELDATPQAVSEYEQKMQQLLELILRERECTRSLDLVGLQAASSAKEQLVRELSGLDSSDFHNPGLAEQVREENRRNAYLYWAGLSLVRDTMSFFGRQVPPPAYGAFGGMVQSRQGTNLLSGRI